MANSGVNGVVRPVGTTYAGVENVARAISRTYVGVENAVRTVNRTYVGVYAPFTAIQILLQSISIWSVDSSGDTQGTITPATLENARKYASITIDEANRSMSIRAYPGYAVQIDFRGVTVGGTSTDLKTSVAGTETFSMRITSSGWAGGSASGRNRHYAFGVSLLPNGWYNSGSDTVTLTKDNLTQSTGDLFNSVIYGSCTDQMTFPATAQVNGLDIPVTLINQLR